MSRPRIAETLGYKVDEVARDDGLIAFKLISPTGDVVLEGTSTDTRQMNARVNTFVRKLHPTTGIKRTLTPRLGTAADAAGELRDQADLFDAKATDLADQANLLMEEADQYHAEAKALHGAADMLESTRAKPEVDPRDQVPDLDADPFDG